MGSSIPGSEEQCSGINLDTHAVQKKSRHHYTNVPASRGLCTWVANTSTSTQLQRTGGAVARGALLLASEGRDCWSVSHKAISRRYGVGNLAGALCSSVELHRLIVTRSHNAARQLRKRMGGRPRMRIPAAQHDGPAAAQARLARSLLTSSTNRAEGLTLWIASIASMYS